MGRELQQPEAETKAKLAVPADHPQTAVQEQPHDPLDSVRQMAHGGAAGPQTDATPLPPGHARPRTADGGGAVAADGFAIVSEGGAFADNPAARAKVEVLPNLHDKFDAAQIAKDIDQACNGGMLWGAGTDVAAVENALKKCVTPQQMAEVDKVFAETYGVNYAKPGQRWGLAEEFKDEMSGATLERNLAVLQRKDEIPPEVKVAGDAVLKPGSDLKAGETNRVTMPDGRIYDVYVPQNAQKPLPVVMMMHGASSGHDMSEKRIFEKESSMNDVAEQYGFAVVYAYNEPRTVEGMLWIDNNPATWNMQGHKNFMPTDKSYDDAKYLDRVLDDVKNRVTADDTRLGLVGMSDGGRAAEQYALDRPGKFAALSIMHGTWMNGEERPRAGDGLPVMMTGGTSDYMLPRTQGDPGTLWGEKGRGFMSWLASSWIPGTSDSRPKQQLPVFKDANQCEGEPTVTKHFDTTLTEYKAEQCKVGPVKEYVIDGANHAWQDWRNEGGWYVVGMPDRNQNMSEETAKFILSHPLKRSF